VLGLGEHQVGHGEEGGGKPHAHVDDPFCQELPGGLAVGGVHHRQVPVQADERQNKYAAVEVHRVDHVHRDAEEVSEVPAAGSIHGPEGQGEDKQEVGHREMQPVFVCHGRRLPLEAHHRHDQSIADDPQQKN
ncbi:hypothetical protein GN956_G13322, partial [Arapaima gigas]